MTLDFVLQQVSVLPIKVSVFTQFGLLHWRHVALA